MDTLERLVAIQEIRDQIARYAIWFDDKDWEAFATLWADDAVFECNDMAFVGKAAVLDFLTNCLPSDYNGKHMNSPPLVEPTAEGDRARARTDVVWISQDFENRIVARYDDSFVWSGGRWLFARRTEVVVPFIAGDPPMSDTALQVSSSTMRP
jgi:ketosteroid isomerase-like protein